MGLTGYADDVGTALFDLAEGLGGAGDSLVDDDGLHLGVVRHVDDGLDGGLKLFGEVVGVDGQLDHVLAVHCLESLGSAAVIFALRNGTGDDADVEVIIVCRKSGRHGKGGQRKDQRQCQHNRKILFHVFLLFLNFRLRNP